RGIAVAITVPERIGKPGENAVQARAAPGRLVIIVGDRVAVRERLEIRHVALEHVVEADRDRALIRRLIVEIGRLRLAIASRRDRHLYPRKQVIEAAARILRSALTYVAIRLLERLVVA